MKPKSVAVLASGGADSACLMEWAAARSARVVPIYVSFGLRWETREKSALRKIVRAMRAAGRKNIQTPVLLSSPAGDLYGRHWSVTGRDVPGRKSRDSAVYLPGRNLLLLSKAAVYCALNRISEILIGTLSANPFSDATHRFFSQMSAAAGGALNRPIRITAPFRGKTKSELIRAYRHLPFQFCFSCLNPRGLAKQPCGRCNKCEEWKKAAAVLI